MFTHNCVHCLRRIKHLLGTRGTPLCPIWPTAWNRQCDRCRHSYSRSRTLSGAERSSASSARRIWTTWASVGCFSCAYALRSTSTCIHYRTCFRAFEHSNIGLKLVVTVLFGAASVAELVHNIVNRDTFASAAIIQIVAPAIEIFAVVRSDFPLVN